MELAVTTMTHTTESADNGDEVNTVTQSLGSMLVGVGLPSTNLRGPKELMIILKRLMMREKTVMVNGCWFNDLSREIRYL